MASKTADARAAKIKADNLRSFYDRRHPVYYSLLNHWLFLEKAYQGGRDWFSANIFKYYKEGDVEYAQRIERAYRFNHTREVVELVQKYLFKAAISRNVANAPDLVKKFWAKATLSGLSIDQFMRQVSGMNAVGGRCAVVIDNNFLSTVVAGGEERPPSIAEAEANNFRIYAYVVPAKDILDYAWDEDGDGDLLWIKLRENVRDDADPMDSSGEMLSRVRLWTRTNWYVYQEIENSTTKAGSKSGSKDVVLKDEGVHNLGFVPVRLADNTVSYDPYRVPGLIDDIAYLDRAVTNYLSSLDAIIQDQTFSQLAIPAQAVMAGDDAYQKVLEMGTKRIFTYDGGAGSTAKPEYLSPDPKQAGVILSVINKIINEIYHTIGLAGERTKEDNAVGIDNSSGVAKAYDFERVNALLLSKAQSCEHVENWIVKTVQAWDKAKEPETALVTYPVTFDVMRLADDLVIAEALAKLEAPIEVRREQMRATTIKLFPQVDAEKMHTIQTNVDKWLEGTDVLPPPMMPTTTGGKPVAAPSRQGSVTADTKSAAK